jgi:hypothetical protein
MMDGLWLVVEKKWAWVQMAALMAGMAGVAAWWLALPVAKTWDLALHGLLLLVLVGFAALGWMVVRRAFLTGAAPWRVVLGSSVFWLAAGVAVISGVVVPAALLRWVPELESLAAQAVSAGVRFMLAGLLSTGSIVWLAACAGRVGVKE